MKTSKDDISRYLRERAARVSEAVIRQLCYAGEVSVGEARRRGRYKDQTGNLRSSTGYVVVSDGKIVGESTFAEVKDGGEGAKTGRALAEDIIKKYQTGWALVVVAGMHYASYVEHLGFDVLESAEQRAREIVPDLLKQLEI